jgi:hypothetical protein
MRTGTKVLPSDASDAESLSVLLPAIGLKLTTVPPPVLSLRPDPILESALSFCRRPRHPGKPS